MTQWDYILGGITLRYIRDDLTGHISMVLLPEGMDSYPFVAEGIKRGVACVPGIAFAADEGGTHNGFRMNYSSPSDENIVRGIDILGGLTHEWMSR